MGVFGNEIVHFILQAMEGILTFLIVIYQFKSSTY